MKPQRRPIRVGQIKYTNVWPVFFYLPLEDLEGRVELINQVPAELNRAMAAGEVDMGPISSFAYGKAYPNYLLYPDLSVSAYGKVGSILLFHKEPLERIVNGRIALPTTSASSVNLLKIIIHKFYGGRPSYTYMAPSLADMMQERDAALLIGDDAIRASWSNRDYLVTDLGEEWQRWTGEWMSFAVWAIRKDTARRYREEVAALFRAFVWSKQQSIKRPEPLIRDVLERIGGTEQYWRRYFGGLCYDFGPQQRKGLETYFRYARELGLIDKDVTIELWSDKTVAQVNE